MKYFVSCSHLSIENFPSWYPVLIHKKKLPLTGHEGTEDDWRYGSTHSSNRYLMRMGLIHNVLANLCFKQLYWLGESTC